MESLRSAIERLASLEVESNPDARQIFMDFRDELTQGKIRAAEKIDGQWVVNIWVKQGILLCGLSAWRTQQDGRRCEPFLRG